MAARVGVSSQKAHSKLDSVRGPGGAGQLAQTLRLMQSEDWQTCRKGLVALDTMLDRDPKAVIPHLREVVSELMTITNSLRTTLSKQGFLTLDHLTKVLGSSLLPQLQSLAPHLLNKTLTEKKFVGQAAMDVLSTVCASVGHSGRIRLLSLMTDALKHDKANRASAQISQILKKLILIMVEKKELSGPSSSSSTALPSSSSSYHNPPVSGSVSSASSCSSSSVMPHLLSALHTLSTSKFSEARSTAKEVALLCDGALPGNSGPSDRAFPSFREIFANYVSKVPETDRVLLKRLLPAFAELPHVPISSTTSGGSYHNSENNPPSSLVSSSRSHPCSRDGSRTRVDSSVTHGKVGSRSGATTPAVSANKQSTNRFGSASTSRRCKLPLGNGSFAPPSGRNTPEAFPRSTSSKLSSAPTCCCGTRDNHESFPNSGRSSFDSVLSDAEKRSIMRGGVPHAFRTPCGVLHTARVTPGGTLHSIAHSKLQNSSGRMESGERSPRRVRTGPIGLPLAANRRSTHEGKPDNNNNHDSKTLDDDGTPTSTSGSGNIRSKGRPNTPDFHILQRGQGGGTAPRAPVPLTSMSWSKTRSNLVSSFGTNGRALGRGGLGPDFALNNSAKPSGNNLGTSGLRDRTRLTFPRPPRNKERNS